VKILSVKVGLPREVEWRGKAVRTSIFKSPVAGRVKVTKLNIAGDKQSDLSVHGGADKAVYVYPAGHYGFWRAEVPGVELSWRAFGENLTVEGALDEGRVQIGDRFRAGSAEFIVTQPRMPCFKLGIRFNRPDMVKRFLHSRRTGFYLAVTREGELGAGDPFDLIAKGEGGVSVADIVELYAADATNQELLRTATQLSALPESWREYFRERLWEPDA